MLKLLKKWACRHKYFLFIDQIRIQEEEKIECACDLCGKKLRVKVFANSYIDQTNRIQLCKKRTYQNKKFAQTVLNTCQQRGRKVQPQRIYRCNKCLGWHLTSKMAHNPEYHEDRTKY